MIKAIQGCNILNPNYMKSNFLIVSLTVLTNILFGQTVVKLTKSNGILSIPCQVNGKSTLFYFDTGASDVVLSIEYYNQALKEGILKYSDLLPEIINFKVANGQVHSGRRINIREIKIGNLRLTNVVGTIIDGQGAPLLLGQTVLERFGVYSIDNQKSTLTINGNLKSDIDIALAAAKQRAVEQMKSSTGDIKIVHQQIQQSKVDLLRDMKVALGLEFEVSSIELDKDEDNQLTFKYDITNNSGIDYKAKALSQLYIFIDVFTEEGKVYSASINTEQMLAGGTINGEDLIIKIRNKTPKYFRIYGVVNGPFLSAIEN